MKTRSSSKEDNSLPSIFRSGPLTSTSTDDSEISVDSKGDKEEMEKDVSTSGSTVFKLPTIDRSRTNSVTSFMSTPNSRTRQSREKGSRRRLCRSPSCPSNIGSYAQQSTELESPTQADKTLLNLTPSNDDNDLKLPNIYRNTNSVSLPTSSQSDKSLPWQSARDLDHVTKRALRRTESCRDAYIESQMEPKVKNHQRTQTHAALLLPIRNGETRVSMKGKKKKQTQASPRTFQEYPSHIQTDLNTGAQNGWESEYEDVYDSARGQNSTSFDRIMEENDSATHVDIPSARNMKPWLKDRPGQKEGQVKA